MSYSKKINYLQKKIFSRQKKTVSYLCIITGENSPPTLPLLALGGGIILVKLRKRRTQQFLPNPTKTPGRIYCLKLQKIHSKAKKVCIYIRVGVTKKHPSSTGFEPRPSSLQANLYTTLLSFDRRLSRLGRLPTYLFPS